MTGAALPVLYSFRRCPYAIRARMALHYAGIAVSVREVALRDKPLSLRAASPKATVPVLLLPDGQVIDESRAIMGWALHQNDPAGWLQAGAAGAAQDWVERNDRDFKPLLDAYKYPGRAGQQEWSDPRARACAEYIEPLERQLGGARFLFGDTPSWADVALFPFVRQFAMVDAAWFAAAPLPAAQAWLRHWLDSALFSAVMHKHALWSDPAQTAQPARIDGGLRSV